MIIKKLSGHTNYNHNNIQESCLDCEECRHENCKWCKEEFYIQDKKFNSFKDATDFENELIKLIPFNKEGYLPIGDNYFFIKDKTLFIHLFLENKSIDARCSKKSSLYAEKFVMVTNRQLLYSKCTCKDKNYDDGNSCHRYGCNNNICYDKMSISETAGKQWII